VAHVYFGINPEIIWQIVSTESVVLRNAVEQIIKQMPKDEENKN